MSSQPKTYTLIVGELVFTTALHLGTGRGSAGNDSPLRRTSQGEIFLPGASLAGALRSLATRLATRLALNNREVIVCQALQSLDGRAGQAACRCPVCHLFGNLQPSNGGPVDDQPVDFEASRLWVYDAPLQSGANAFIRDRVGIDRRSRTAARAGRIKFDTEIVPAGARFALRLELEKASPEDEMLLAAALAEWQAGRAWLGGDTARGLGHAHLENVRFLYNRLDTAEALLAYLQAERPEAGVLEKDGWLNEQVAQVRQWARVGAQPPFIQAEITLDFDGLLLSHDSTAAADSGFDHHPLMDSTPHSSETQPPVLPGSALRGALRSHAERIARTLMTSQVHALCPDLGDRQRVAEFARRCPACDPTQDQEAQALLKCDKAVALKPAVPLKPVEVEPEHLCLACRLFGSAGRGSRLKVTDAALLGQPVWKPVDFLAVDRFTGGGLDTAKFDALALWRPSFRFTLLLEEPQAWELGWLAHLLRDLHDGRVTFGFGAAKGFGRQTARQIEIKAGFVAQADGRADWNGVAAPLEWPDAPGFYRLAVWSGQVNTPGPALTGLVGEWMQAFAVQVRDFNGRKDEAQRQPIDTYFGVADHLYPVVEGSHVETR